MLLLLLFLSSYSYKTKKLHYVSNKDVANNIYTALGCKLFLIILNILKYAV